jgi:hypothetical protein
MGWKRSHHESFWCATATGEPSLDVELGSIYAIAYLKYLRDESASMPAPLRERIDENGAFSYLFVIAEQIRQQKHGGHVLSGFLSTIERWLRHAATPAAGWVDIESELDGQTWDQIYGRIARLRAAGRICGGRAGHV